MPPRAPTPQRAPDTAALFSRAGGDARFLDCDPGRFFSIVKKNDAATL
ncbi:MAG TPA: hypothetical protein VN802_08830 [Stellaceae bacterium]|nr:hypothetical protein [Stellaceae bacterium]